MNAYNLERFIREIDHFGVTDVLLPFILLFTIFYAIFQKAKILGEKKGINAGIAFVLGLLPVVLHVTHKYPPGFDIIDIMNQAIPGISLVAVMMISLLIFFAIFGGKVDKFNFATIGVWTVGIITVFVVNTVWYNNEDFSFLISMIILAVMIFTTFATGFPGLYDIVISFSVCFVLYIFGRKVGWFSELPNWIFDSNFTGLGITLGIIFLILGFVLRPEEKTKK